MKYFIVEDSLDEKVVGKDFPQAYKFIKGYNPDTPNMLLVSLVSGIEFQDVYNLLIFNGL